MEKTVSARYLPEENPALQIQVDARHEENWRFPRPTCIRRYRQLPKAGKFIDQPGKTNISTGIWPLGGNPDSDIGTPIAALPPRGLRPAVLAAQSPILSICLLHTLLALLNGPVVWKIRGNCLKRALQFGLPFHAATTL